VRTVLAGLLLWLLIAPRVSGAPLVLRVIDADAAPVASAVLVALDGSRGSGTVTLDQRGKQFRPGLVLASPGQRLVISNSDPLLHTVRASHPALSFNIALSQGQSASFALPGRADVLLLCDIHAHMRSRLVVLPSAHWAISNATGCARIKAVSGGPGLKYQLWTAAHGFGKATRLSSRNELKVSWRVAGVAASRPAIPRVSRPAGAMLIALRRISTVMVSRPKAAQALLRSARRDLQVGIALRARLRATRGRRVAFAFEERLRELERRLTARPVDSALPRALADLIRFVEGLAKAEEGGSK